MKSWNYQVSVKGKICAKNILLTIHGSMHRYYGITLAELKRYIGTGKHLEVNDDDDKVVFTKERKSGLVDAPGRICFRSPTING